VDFPETHTAQFTHQTKVHTEHPENQAHTHTHNIVTEEKKKMNVSGGPVSVMAFLWCFVNIIYCVCGLFLLGETVLLVLVNN
jgi:hypothetical protein